MGILRNHSSIYSITDCKVSQMRDESSVDYLFDNTIVRKITDFARIDEIRGNGIIKNDLRDVPQIGQDETQQTNENMEDFKTMAKKLLKKCTANIESILEDYDMDKNTKDELLSDIKKELKDLYSKTKEKATDKGFEDGYDKALDDMERAKKQPDKEDAEPTFHNNYAADDYEDEDEEYEDDYAEDYE